MASISRVVRLPPGKGRTNKRTGHTSATRYNVVKSVPLRRGLSFKVHRMETAVLEPDPESIDVRIICEGLRRTRLLGRDVGLFFDIDFQIVNVVVPTAGTESRK